ncbi:MAG: hypothetical protein ACREP7_15145 [Lysobacter sp.]
MSFRLPYALTFAALVFALGWPGVSDARQRASGSHHTTSHGGHYSSGRGSSHRGGSYRSTSTGNRYRKHK